jgi:hypothetical protein
VGKERRSYFDGIVVYFWWNVWKERNRRIFQHSSLDALAVANLIKENVQQFQQTTPLGTASTIQASD